MKRIKITYGKYHGYIVEAQEKCYWLGFIPYWNTLEFWGCSTVLQTGKKAMQLCDQYETDLVIDHTH